MKLLIVGIDGGTASIFDAFDMPFWRSLRQRDVVFPIREDLNQRGWAKMLSGQGAEETGGLYVRPKLDGSRDLTVSFGYKEMSQASGFRPIWSLAEKAGATIGMMNVPTTAPAQNVNGFYVSGGGGGIFQGGFPEDAVYPEEIRSELDSVGYIFDTRLGAQSFSRIDTLCKHLKSMMSARQVAFSRLARKFGIDFGFVAFRATTVMQYLAMSEIAHAMRHEAGSPERRSWSPRWLPLLEDHFRSLDQCLKLLFSELEPEHYIIASDHSIVPWTHDVDYNGFLAARGYSHYCGMAGRLFRNAARVALRKDFRSQLMDTPVRHCLGTLRTGQARLAETPRAFSGNQVYGIYVNDRDRFGGPVPVEAVDEEVSRIVSDFNWDAEQNQRPLRAEPYRTRFRGGRCERQLPDVTILQSGHAFPSRLGLNWYCRNPNFGPIESVVGVGGMHSGQKGTEPIVIANRELAALKSEDDPMDLRLVHALTRRLFSG